jgi:uncharacterized phiE125 gp8 family phage protein
MQTIQTSRVTHGNEPITLADLKTALGITGSDHDNYLGDLLTSAREYAEAEGNVGLVLQTVTAWLNEMPDWVQLPFAPIVSITSVKTYANGTLVDTLTYGNDYYIVGDRIYFNMTSTYQVQIVYEAGYYNVGTGTTTTTTASTAPEYSATVQLCPRLAKVAIERLVRDWYDNPDMIGTLGRDARQIIRKFGRRDWI